MKPTLHLLGIPHTVSFDERYTHCAFTTKVNRFEPMMRSIGFNVIHYGNGPGNGLSNVRIFSEDELIARIGKFDPHSISFIGGHANMSSELYREFNEKVARALDDLVKPGDMVCLPFGYGHHEAFRLCKRAKDAYWVETGIGYEHSFAPFRVFESSAWMHYHYGRQSTQGNNRGSDYDWVIPNYFDLKEWSPSYAPGGYVLYFGRIGEAKGMDIVRALALERPNLRFVVCGQGDASPWKTPNMEIRPPVFGMARSELLRGAIAVLVPSRYVEPFGGVAVEAMLCGRPVLTSVFGAFSETIGPHCFSCRTLKDWLNGLDYCDNQMSGFKYIKIRDHAETEFDMLKLAVKYDKVFRQIADLSSGGWGKK